MRVEPIRPVRGLMHAVPGRPVLSHAQEFQKRAKIKVSLCPKLLKLYAWLTCHNTMLMPTSFDHVFLEDSAYRSLMKVSQMFQESQKNLYIETEKSIVTLTTSSVFLLIVGMILKAVSTKNLLVEAVFWHKSRISKWNSRPWGWGQSKAAASLVRSTFLLRDLNIFETVMLKSRNRK